MNLIIGAVGLLTRTARPRGRHLLANFLHRWASGRIVSYRDRWGYVHTARFADHSEALGFVGKPALPTQLERRVSRGDWAIDVGANVGIVTAELCHLVGPAGTVWAIEPFPPNIETLLELREVNGLNQLDVIAGALSSSQGTAHLRLPNDGNSAHPSLAKTSDLIGEIDVHTWSLDDLVASRRPNRPLAFIKIDVEGHEMAVLDGAEKTLRNLRPMILCEFNELLLREGGSSSAELLDRLSGLGYRPIMALREGRPLAEIPAGASPATLVSMEDTVVDLLFEPI